MDLTFQITINGIVQGVGFRPFIYNLATDMNLTGTVINSSQGLIIVICTPKDQLDIFVSQIQSAAPPLSHISTISIASVPVQQFDTFTILESQDTGGLTLVSPDTAICDHCKAELFDSADRRHEHPFINCTDCGPRYSIIQSIPYDRPKTTMGEFEMCGLCNSEYIDPTNRRFHAQPNCCSECGPEITYNEFTGIDAVRQIASRIDEGDIVAVKGLGGYHLICDATNSATILQLRQLKNRPSKPLAIMCQSTEILTLHNFTLSEAEQQLISSPQAPIVITEWPDHPLSEYVNPANDRIGIMTAYTPLHQLLLKCVKTDFIIATSGNIKDEPICTDPLEAEEKLQPFTRHYLHHNRHIHTGIDDSVATVINEKPYILRRARGFAPYPVMLPDKLDATILGLGAHLKSTVTLGSENYGFVSQYIGDLDHPETVSFYEDIVQKMRNLYHLSPDVIITDKHPAYHSSRYAAQFDKPVLQLQHHHAHMLACMAENNLTDKTIGVIFDGTGLGEDGAIWGGEFFTLTGKHIKRTHHLKYVKQPGMDGAAKNPYRMLISYLHNTGLLNRYTDLLINTFSINQQEIDLLKNMMDKNINSIDTSSMGRLFEAIGSLLTGIKTNEYEGHTAILMESMVDKDCLDFYKINEDTESIDLYPIINGVFNDLAIGVNKATIAAKFHNTIATLITGICIQLSDRYQIDDVVLSGGVFQNITLLNKTVSSLTTLGLKPHIHSRVPANDGCISLGQVYGYALGLTE